LGWLLSAIMFCGRPINREIVIMILVKLDGLLASVVLVAVQIILMWHVVDA
jgi:hypothetical protein